MGDGGETQRRGGGGGGGSGGGEEEEEEVGGVGSGKRSRRAMRFGRQVEGRKGVGGWVGCSGGEGGWRRCCEGPHYVFHRRIWNPINQAEERRDAERMRSPFTLMRPGRGKRSTT